MLQESNLSLATKASPDPFGTPSITAGIVDSKFCINESTIILNGTRCPPINILEPDSFLYQSSHNPALILINTFCSVATAIVSRRTPSNAPMALVFFFFSSLSALLSQPVFTAAVDAQRGGPCPPETCRMQQRDHQIPVWYRRSPGAGGENPLLSDWVPGPLS